MSDKKPNFSLFSLEYSKALLSAVDPTGLSSERNIRRQYSILFHTPLHIVYTLDFTFILQNMYEHKFQSYTKQQLATEISAFIPELGQAIEDENQEFMRQLEATINEKNKKKLENAKTPPKKQSEIKEDVTKAPEISMSFPDEDPDFL
jgi:hypothetical protein